MKVSTIGGIDPGLVDTGVVRIQFEPDFKRIYVASRVVSGVSDQAIRDIEFFLQGLDQVWIEGYRPRSNLGTDRRMLDAVSRLKKATGYPDLDNMGIKKIITPGLMQVLGCWMFSTPTHHQDLRSAARIALLGYIKTEEGNRMVADVVRDHLAGEGWLIV
jgi:hypothetical protein